jgi:hypothetical protein
MTRDGVPLPPGWVEAIASLSGRTYFANPMTGESSWIPPSLITGQEDGDATMIHAAWMERDKEGSMDYPNLTPGMIADLCFIQQKYSIIKKYVPIKPTKSTDSKPSAPATACELRIAELYRQLHEVKPP